MNKYKYLFFDLDHTLWDFEQNSINTLQVLFNDYELAEKCKTSFETFNEIYHEINDKLWARFRSGHLSREDLRWKRMFQTLVHFRIGDQELAYKMSDHYLDVLPTQTALFPHVIDVLTYCQSKEYEIHLITNGFEKTQHEKLRNASIHQFFGRMITSEEAMSIKPQKEIFEFAMKQTGADASNSIMIGDALDIDILGAQQVGMDQVFFNPHSHKHESNPTYEIKSLHELMTIL